MKNTKKILTILSLSAVVLIGCGYNDAVERTETPIEETSDVVEEPKDDVVKEDSTDAEDITVMTDTVVVTSNHSLGGNYFINDMQIYKDGNFDNIQTFEEYKANKDVVESINEEILTTVSNELKENPYVVTGQTGQVKHFNQLKEQGSKQGIVLENNKDRNHTNILILDKNIDKYMNENYHDEGITNIIDILDSYEADLNNAENTSQINKTIFENDNFIVKLAPSMSILSMDLENDNHIQNLNDYAEYFTTDEVQAIFEKHLGK